MFSIHYYLVIKDYLVSLSIDQKYIFESYEQPNPVNLNMLIYNTFLGNSRW